MSENKKIIQYAQRPIKIKLEKLKKYNSHYIMLHIVILILPLDYILLLMKR